MCESLFEHSPKYLTLYSLAILIVVRIPIRTTITIASEYRVRYFGL